MASETEVLQRAAQNTQGSNPAGQGISALLAATQGGNRQVNIGGAPGAGAGTQAAIGAISNAGYGVSRQFEEAANRRENRTLQQEQFRLSQQLQKEQMDRMNQEWGARRGFELYNNEFTMARERQYQYIEGKTAELNALITTMADPTAPVPPEFQGMTTGEIVSMVRGRIREYTAEVNDPRALGDIYERRQAAGETAGVFQAGPDDNVRAMISGEAPEGTGPIVDDVDLIGAGQIAQTDARARATGLAWLGTIVDNLDRKDVLNSAANKREAIGKILKIADNVELQAKGIEDVISAMRQQMAGPESPTVGADGGRTFTFSDRAQKFTDSLGESITEGGQWLSGLQISKALQDTFRNTPAEQLIGFLESKNLTEIQGIRKSQFDPEQRGENMQYPPYAFTAVMAPLKVLSDRLKTEKDGLRTSGSAFGRSYKTSEREAMADRLDLAQSYVNMLHQKAYTAGGGDPILQTALTRVVSATRDGMLEQIEASGSVEDTPVYELFEDFMASYGNSEQFIRRYRENPRSYMDELFGSGITRVDPSTALQQVSGGETDTLRRMGQEISPSLMAPAVPASPREVGSLDEVSNLGGRK